MLIDKWTVIFYQLKKNNFPRHLCFLKHMQFCDCIFRKTGDYFCSLTLTNNVKIIYNFGKNNDSSGTSCIKR